MELEGWNRDTSPYHAGEQELHARLGRKDHQTRMGRQIHRPFMPEQHRSFFAQLPFMVAGSVDADGWPWASMLFGQPGFVTTPDDKTVAIKAQAVRGDPFQQAAQAGAPVSFVGIELPTRRRNRVNGVVRGHRSGTFTVDVVQSFGNCPQYIHTRDMEFTRDPAKTVETPIEPFATLDTETTAMIRAADTFFVASHNDRDDKFDTGGVDINHRGGRAGFIKVDGNTLTIPDYIGNFAFNTLGNFLVNPKAGLLFVDFDTGDLVQLTGTVDLMWDPEGEVAAFKGAERAWRFHLDHGHRLRSASPLRFTQGEASPNAKLTGNWEETAQTIAMNADRAAWRPFEVRGIAEESAVIRSITLVPADGKARMPHKPGQFLTVRVTPQGANRAQVRTYTLSSAPADDAYRISVKREAEGAVSGHLHDEIKVGDVIETRAPSGGFWMDTDERRPAALFAGGVGITPMIAMARQTRSDALTRRHQRPLTVFHAAHSTAQRAFADEFAALERESEGALRYVSVIGSPADGEVAGKQFHAQGRLNAEVVQAHLPLADYDYFLCGPPAFMQSVYDMLIGLGAPDARIFAESFGPASLRRISDTSQGAPQDPPVFDAVNEAVVTFEASAVEQVWTPADGTLLELAEGHGLTPNFGCRNGACGSCAVRLVSGAVGYKTRPKYEAAQGKILVCCAVPAASDEALVLDL